MYGKQQLPLFPTSTESERLNKQSVENCHHSQNKFPPYYKALLILETEIDINNQIGMSCLSNHQESIETLSQRQCFITSLEYTNGRYVKYFFPFFIGISALNSQ